MNNFKQLKEKLQRWEKLALYSHWVHLISMIPYLLEKTWGTIPLVIGSCYVCVCYYKYLDTRHKFRNFGDND
jgi:hypothetical protein